MQGDNSAWIKFIVLAVIAFIIWWLLHLIFGRNAKAKASQTTSGAAQGIRAAGDSVKSGVGAAAADATAGLDRAGDAVRRGADDLGGDLKAGAGAAAAGLGAAAAAAGAGLDRAGDAVRGAADDVAGGVRGAAGDVAGAAEGLAGEADAALGRAKDRVEDAAHDLHRHGRDAANGAAGAVAGLDMPSANVDLAGAIDAVPGAVGGIDLPGGLDARGLGVDAAAALGGVGAALGADEAHRETLGEKIGEFVEGIVGNAGALTDIDADGTPDLPGMEEIEGEIARGAAGSGAVAEEWVAGREFVVREDGSREEIAFAGEAREHIPHPHAHPVAESEIDAVVVSRREVEFPHGEADLGLVAEEMVGGREVPIRSEGGIVAEEWVAGRDVEVHADGSLGEIPFPEGGRDGIPHPHAEGYGDGDSAFIHEGGALGGDHLDAAAIAAAGHVVGEEIIGGREYEVTDLGEVELKATYPQAMPAPPRLAGTFTSNAEATLLGGDDDRVINLGRREPGERPALAGSDTLWDVMQKANPPREPGDDSPRPEDARMYLAAEGGEERATLGGSDTLWEAIEKSTPEREPGDTSPRPEDARMYIASGFSGAFERGGGITAWTWDEGAVDDRAGVANPRGGTCPRDYPVKGNRNSMIYHESWMGTWLPTVPEVCFRTADAAEAAGFRRPRNAQNAGPDQAPLIAQALASAWHSSDPMPVGLLAEEADAEVVLVLPEGAVWATGGECPGDYPLKGNLDSNLYHAPGWPSYQATIAEVCFPDIITAEDAGYDWPKNAEGYPGAGSYKSKGRAAGEPKPGKGGGGSGGDGDARQGVKASGGDGGSGGSGRGSGSGGSGAGGGKVFAGGASSATASTDAQGRALPKGAHWASGGDCPASRPIKGNLSSMLYHRPGTQFYANTDAEVCFASEADAEAAGYELPPSQRNGAGHGGSGSGGSAKSGGGGSDSGGSAKSGGGGSGSGGSAKGSGGDGERQGVKASGGSGGDASGEDDEGKTTRSGRKAPKGSKLPQGDGCPSGYPVKGNMDSMLYHAPGWPSYEATIPEVCFRTTQGAAAAGFDRPKNAPDS